MSIKDRKREIRYSVDSRKLEEELSGNSVSPWFVGSCCLLITFSLVAGVWLGSQNPVVMDEVNETIEVEDYSFHIVSSESDEKMKGNWGYTYVGSKHVWLNKDLLKHEWFPKQFVETCQHELLHTYGISEKHHDKIDLFEDQVNDPICSQLKNKVES